MPQEPRKNQQPDRLAKLQSEIGMLQHQVKRLELAGGFADSKTLSKRCLRIEQRLEKLERLAERQTIQVEGWMRAAKCLVSALSDHLKDRHGADLVLGTELDVMSTRNAARQMFEASTSLDALARRSAP
jgi:hypothetical protein